MDRSTLNLSEVELSSSGSGSFLRLWSPRSADNKEAQEHPWPLLRILWKVILWIVMLVVGAIVLYFQITNWPQSTNIYYTNNPWDNMRGGVAHTCGCSLPSNLPSADPKNLASAKNGNLNVCYETSSLETVTVLMYSNSTAASDLNSFFSVYSSNVTVAYTTTEGYRVSQEAHDLSSGLTSTFLPDESDAYDIKSLFLGGYMQPDVLATIDYLQSTQFNNFPTSYSRLGFHYSCNSCATCGIENISSIIANVVDGKEVWAGCFPWLNPNNQQCQFNPSISTYQGKCLFYPPQVLPANLALQRFLELFLNDTQLPGISGVTPVDVDDLNWYNYTSLQPSFLYLNTSQVEESSIGLGFVEVPQGSALWVSLLNLFPSLDYECASLPLVYACNGTSVCNVFANANSYDVRCLDMKNQSRCLNLQNDAPLSADNVESLTAAGLTNSEIICPPFNCQTVPPYTAVWNTSQEMETDALNQFLSAKILNKAWAQRSGVCTNTYSNVFRHNPGPAELGTAGVGGASRSDENTMFLETNCTSNALNRSSTYCWLTGYYHSLTDSPETPLKNLSDNLFSDPTNMFVCYRVHRQKFEAWFITTFGVLFGWLGSVQLLFQMFLWIFRKVEREREERNTSPVFPGAPGK